MYMKQISCSTDVLVSEKVQKYEICKALPREDGLRRLRCIFIWLQIKHNLVSCFVN